MYIVHQLYLIYYNNDCIVITIVIVYSCYLVNYYNVIYNYFIDYNAYKLI